jgi:hypothetical protein
MPESSVNSVIIRKALSATECNCETMPSSIVTLFSPDLHRVHILTTDFPGKTPNPRNLRVIQAINQ